MTTTITKLHRLFNNLQLVQYNILQTGNKNFDVELGIVERTDLIRTNNLIDDILKDLK